MTDRPHTTALFHLRTIQMGLTFRDLFHLTKGEIIDLIIESANDREKYDEQGNQDDIDHFFDYEG